MNKGECLVPIVVDRLINGGKCRVRVIPTDSRWFGMTYERDVQAVKEEIAACVAGGEYPERLWSI